MMACASNRLRTVRKHRTSLVFATTALTLLTMTPRLTRAIALTKLLGIQKKIDVMIAPPVVTLA